MRKHILFVSIFLFCVALSACKNEIKEISDLENQIFEEYAPYPNEVGYSISYENFKNILLKFPETSFSYNFKKLTGISYVKIVGSPDQTIRTYTKNDGGVLAIQVKSENNIYTFDLDEDKLRSLNLYSFENLTNIISVITDRGSIIYILCNEDNNAVAIRLMGEELQQALVFEKEKGVYSSLLYSGVSEIDAKIDYNYDSGKLVFHKHETEDAVEYVVYKFNGRVFKKNDAVEESLLHASVQDYEALMYRFLSKKVNVRIDRLKGGKFRYASWINRKEFSEKPDLVLFSNDVKVNYETGVCEFTFNNKGYSYIMKINEDDEKAELFVKKDGKILASYIED